MKNRLLTFFFSSIALVSAAQLDEQYYGRYTDQMDLTGIEIYALEDEGLEDYCFMVTRNRYNEIGESVYTEVGFARCKQENGQYVAEIESDEANLWLVFETDEFGNKTVTAHEKDKPAESFFYNPLDEDLYESEYYEEEYEESPDSLAIQEYEEGLSDYETNLFEGAEYELYEPDIYSCDGSVLMLMKNGDNLHFMIIGEESESCESIGADGSLSLIDASQNTYAYDFGGCTLFTLKLEGNQAILTEKRCDGYRPKKCKTWSGTYILNTK